MDYRISRYVADIGSSGNEDPFIALPVTREDFNQRTRQVPGSRLVSYSYDENEDYIMVEAVLDFNDGEAVSAFFDGSADVTVSGGKTSFSYLVFAGEGNEMSPDTLDKVDTLFADETITLTLNTPEPVEEYSGGQLSENRREIIWTVGIPELVRYQENVIWTAVW
jgi:hypothetical protein